MQSKQVKYFGVALELEQLIKQALNELDLSVSGEISLEHPADQTHGDYSCNIALTSFAQVKSDFKNPRVLAQAIADKISSPILKKVEVAGPGFINFYLSREWLIKQMQQIAAGKLVAADNETKKIIIEYSSANIAKPFTIGHLRSTIIGDAIANLYEALGWMVYRDNHLGDWGTQFGKQIYAIKTWGDEQALEDSKNPVKDLVALYIKFHEEAEKDPSLEEKGRAWFKKLEDGDPEARRLWKKCVNWSLKEFQRIYDILGVKFTENNGVGYGESFFEDKMTPVIQELEEKKLLIEGKEGAKLVFFPHDEYSPMMILKKDGATLYATRDLATDKFRLDKYGKDILIVNEVGAEQALYFAQLFRIEEMLGWVKQGQRIHVGHGLYRFKDKKMSTRKGNVVWLEDIFKEAFERVQKRAKSKLPNNAVRSIAIGALKWNDLRREASKNVTFDLDEILSLEGNSGPYLQYCYVRCLSVLQKAKVIKNSDITKPFDILLNIKSYSNLELNSEEIDILRNLYKYSEVVKLAAREFAPHHICTYLYSLAQKYNSFYNNHKINDSEFRLVLTMAVAQTIKAGLALLGIQVVEKM